MSFRVVPRSDVPSAEWDAWVGVHPCGELWHLHYMQDVLAKRTQHEDRSFAVIDQRGELRGLMPLQHRRSGCLARVLGLSELSSLGGALIELSSPRQLREVQDVVTQGVRDAIEDSRSIRVHAELGVHLADLEPRAPTAVNPLVYLGFECGQKFSWVLDLRKSMEDLRRGYVKSARQELRKVEDTALAVREAGGGRDLEAYYSLHLDTYRRTKAMPHPFEYIEAIFPVRPARSQHDPLRRGRGSRRVCPQHGTLQRGLAVLDGGLRERCPRRGEPAPVRPSDRRGAIEIRSRVRLW